MSTRSLLFATVVAATFAAPALSQSTNPSAQPTPVPMPITPPTLAPLQVAPTSDTFFTDSSQTTHWRSSETVGQSVYNRTGERIGEIDELLIGSNGRVVAALVGVGGFLGIGERSVAIAYSALEMMRGPDGKSRMVINIDKATLKNAPEYNPAHAAKRT